MSSVLNEDHMRRLALVRFLINQANNQTSQPEVIRSLALLSFHDAIELFLQVVAETKGAQLPKKPEFLDYWSAIEKEGFILPPNSAMKRLNQARVSLKHQGILPDAKDLNGYAYAAKHFIDTVCESAFGFGIESVSLVQLISNEDARVGLLEAEAACNNDDFRMAIANCAIVMRRYFASNILMGGYKAQINRELGALSAKLQKNIGPKDKTITKLSTIVDSFSEAISLVSLSVKIEEYTYFKSITPIIQISLAGNHQVVWGGTSEADKNKAEWCINFTTTCLMKIEERIPTSGKT